MQRILTAQDHLHEGIASRFRGELNEAIGYFNQALSLNPEAKDSRLIYLHRGLAYQGIGKHNNAIDDFSQILATEPYHNDRCAYIKRGNSYQKNGERDKAIADFTEALRNDYQDADILYKRGIILQEQGKHDEAIADFTKALEINPNPVSPYYARGISYREKGERGKAILDYLELLVRNPKYQTVAVGEQARAFAKDISDQLNKFNKIEIFNEIKKLPTEQQIPLLNACLDENSCLGKCFWTQKGVRSCALSRGTLSEINKYLKTLEDKKNSNKDITEGKKRWVVRDSFFNDTGVRRVLSGENYTVAASGEREENATFNTTTFSGFGL